MPEFARHWFRDQQRPRRGASLACALLVGALACASAPAAEDVTFFESQVRPLLVERCVKCHGDKKQEGGLRLDSRRLGTRRRERRRCRSRQA